MQHLDEGTIHAWLDGELAAAERAAAEAHVALCPGCAAAVAEARGFIAASSRILTALDAVPGGVLPAQPARRFIASRAWMAVAAVLVLGIGTVIATRPRRDLVAPRVAQGKDIRVAPTPAPRAAPPAANSSAARAEAPAAPKRFAKARAPMSPSPSAEGVAGGKVAAPASLADTARPRALALSQIVVSGAGVATSKAADDAEPTLVSRDTTTLGADTTVTTIYDVRGERVSLIDRPSRTEPKRPAAGFSDAVTARAKAAAMNSITWSDSAGRTHTLRGTLSSAQLERIKAQLFGATP